MAFDDKSREPLQNLVKRSVGGQTVWGMTLVDADGNTVLVDSLSFEIRFDYDVRTDGQPLYVGYAPAGTAAATAIWLIHKFTFTTIAGVDNVTRRQVATNVAWTARTTSF